ncbi:MAG: hypothetical protein JSR15_04430 [Proteobacteria bacterium]|nr:hypothetical protein [Pseudomonadota bacterium]
METAKPGYAQPFPMTVRKPRVLFLADLADRMQRGTVKEQRAALGDLSADLAFWMRVLHGQGTLLSTMLAVAFVHGDELLLVDAIQDPMVPITAFDSQYPWLTPMPNTAWQIGDAFAAEMRFMYEVLRPVQFSPRVRSRKSPDSLGNRIAPTFFKLNATMNLQAERVSQLQALAVGDPDTFSARQREFEEWNLKALSSISLASVYNPMGRMMLATEGSAFVRYIGRSYDVAAVQRLGCLVYQLRKQNIATKDVAAFMATHPEISTHPVDRTPFLWNAKTRELTVPRKAEWPVGRRFSVTLAPEPQ